jgi:nucleotide-binding universal stress UspA family protein
MYERILVPLKWDSSDEAVIEHAGAMALVTGGHVTLLHVVHSHSRDEAAYLREQAQTYLDEMAAMMSSRGVVVATKTVVGEPAEGISASARETDADLIVMATHGHSEMRHVFVGSVTEDVIRRSATPVLLIRPSVLSELQAVEDLARRPGQGSRP